MTDPRQYKSARGLSPYYGNVEAMISAGIDYINDAVLEAHTQNAGQNMNRYDQMLTEMGIVSDPELKAAIENSTASPFDTRSSDLPKSSG